MPEPTNLMRKEAARLFPEAEDDQGAFLDALLDPNSSTRRPAIIWTRPEFRGKSSFEECDKPDFIPEEISFLAPDAVPGKSEAFERGAIYPMDVSSVFSASALLAANCTDRVLDVCAAPGGKSIFASVVLRPELLISNEVIGKRLGILRHNLKKVGLNDVYTQNLDPGDLAEIGKSLFDLVLVDAPCSGQSLLAKGIDNPGCFHPNIVKGNAKRQKRILRQSSECVVSGGFLFYSTCTFAYKENESVVEKFLSRNPDFETVRVSHLDEFQSPLSEENCYRIYPHQKRGVGGFVALMKRVGGKEKMI